MRRHLRKLIPEKYRHLLRPVCRIRVAMYGLKRSGADFGQKLIKDMTSTGWKKVRDTSPSMWIKLRCLAIAYVDDIGLSGPKGEAYIEYASLDKRIGFGKKSKDHPELTMYAGICYEALGFTKSGALRYRLHQIGYCEMLVSKYKKMKGISMLKPVSTPMNENIEIFEGHDLPGVEAPRAR